MTPPSRDYVGYGFMAAEHGHSHDVEHGHSHDVEHGHSHEILDGPGSFMGREMPLIEGRDWNDRAFTIGIGGYAFSSVDTLAIPRLGKKRDMTISLWAYSRIEADE